MALTAKECREKAFELKKQATALHQERSENWTSEDQEQFDRIYADVNKFKAQAENIEKIESLNVDIDSVIENVTRSPSGRKAGGDGATLKLRSGRIGHRGGSIEYAEIPVGKRGSESYREAFAKFMKRTQLSSQEYAALQSDNAEQAGYLIVPEQLAAGVLQDLDDLLWIRQLATVHQVREAGSLGITKRTAKAATAAWGGELTVPTEDTTLAFGKKVLTPHYLSVLIKVSNDLMRRSMLGVEAIVRGELALDAAELQESAFMTGDGVQKPLGLFTASSNGISTGRDVAGDNSTTAITSNTLRTVKYSLKAGHRRNARWLFHRDAISNISKLREDGATGNYLWQQGQAVGDPDTLLGLPIAESEYVPNTFTSGNYVGMLGDFRYYHIADALDMEMRRLEELYALTNQTAFLGRQKTDGMPVLEEAFVRIKLATG